MTKIYERKILPFTKTEVSLRKGRNCSLRIYLKKLKIDKIKINEPERQSEGSLLVVVIDLASGSQPAI